MIYVRVFQYAHMYDLCFAWNILCKSWGLLVLAEICSLVCINTFQCCDGLSKHEYSCSENSTENCQYDLSIRNRWSLSLSCDVCCQYLRLCNNVTSASNICNSLALTVLCNPNRRVVSQTWRDWTTDSPISQYLCCHNSTSLRGDSVQKLGPIKAAQRGIASMINNIEIAGLHLVWRNCFTLTAPYAAVNSQQRI
jgi:hypothetical protein